MAEKEVNFYKIESHDSIDISSFILRPETRLPEGSPPLEIDYIEERSTYITGFFVKTVRTEIPPSHKPGDKGDYTTIILPDGSGLAFPAVFLFIKNINILIIESNRRCITMKSLERFLNTKIKKIDPSHFINIYPILHEDVYNRLRNVKRLLKVEMQVATPNELINSYGKKNSSLNDLAGFLKHMNVDNSAKIVIESEAESFGLNIPQMLLLSKFFSRLKPKTENKRKKNCFKVYGTFSDDKENMIDDIVDLYTDRMKDSFIINDKLNKGLHHEDRLSGIESIYEARKELLSKLFC